MMVQNLHVEIFTMIKTIFGLMFAMLFTTFVFAQTEEPDWQDVMTHRADSEGTTKEAADSVLKAILYDSHLPEDVSITVTHFVEFCDDLHDKQCFAAALYTVDLSPNLMDEMQFFVWMDRMWITNDRFEYRKVCEYRTESGNASGSLSLIHSANPPFDRPCLLVKTADDSNAFHAVKMRLLCRNQTDYPEILWEYDADYTHESLAQAFRKSIVSFRDTDDDEIDELILDSVEGYLPDEGQSDRIFQITMHRTVFYYEYHEGKYLGSGLVPAR